MTTAGTVRPRLVDICREPGAWINLGECRWPAALVSANVHLLTLLTELCGAGENIGAGRGFL